MKSFTSSWFKTPKPLLLSRFPQFNAMLEEHVSGRWDIIPLPDEDQERFRLFENCLRMNKFNLEEENEQLGLETDIKYTNLYVFGQRFEIYDFMEFISQGSSAIMPRREMLGPRAMLYHVISWPPRRYLSFVFLVFLVMFFIFLHFIMEDKKGETRTNNENYNMSHGLMCCVVFNRMVCIQDMDCHVMATYGSHSDAMVV